MRKDYYRDWQENTGYEDYWENQSDGLQDENEKVDDIDTVKSNNGRDGMDVKSYVQQI